MSRESFKTGFSFGITSAVITTLGLIVGLHSGTHSKTVVLGAIITIAVADAFSDALGIHVSEESENKHTKSEIWLSALATFAAKFFFALTFAVPVLIFNLYLATLICVGWGMVILGIFSYLLGKRSGNNPWNAVGEHLLIAAVVILITHYIGDWIGVKFK